MIYVCPMHPEVTSDSPGKCHKCGMALVAQDKLQEAAKSSGEKKGFLGTYKPLLIIIALVALASFAGDLADGTLFWKSLFQYFMAGFFLVFSGFKLLDIKGFASGYSTYDLLAKRVYAYGYVYPFIELALGLSYLMAINLQMTNMITVAVMLFSGTGVLIEIAQKREIKCVCLGTIIDVPLTSVTLIEDFGMAAMAFIMLVGA